VSLSEWLVTCFGVGEHQRRDVAPDCPKCPEGGFWVFGGTETASVSSMRLKTWVLRCRDGREYLRLTDVATQRFVVVHGSAEFPCRA